MLPLNPEDWSLFQSIAIFLCCALAIGLFGTWITRVVDQLADRTGVGEAVAGALLLGAATSLSGSVLSVTAAWKGHPELAVGNALGGIAVQTLFLAVADFFHCQANLEHAAASAANMMQNALLISLLALILLAPGLPNVTLWGIHPVTPLLLGLYIYGIQMVRGARRHPMWKPAYTRNTRPDVPDDTDAMPSLGSLWLRFLGNL
jgi:cation:H+ antiporter